MKIQVIFTGRSYQRANAIPDELSLPESATLDDALRALQADLPDEQRLPTSCLISVSGRHVGTLGSHGDCPLSDGDELVLIAPVAGG